MKIQCPGCQHEGIVPEDKVPAAGVTVSCPKCKTKFEITPPPDLPSKTDFYCPKCKTKQPESDICIKCGIVFSRYSSAQENQKPQKPEVEELPANNFDNFINGVKQHKFKILIILMLFVLIPPIISLLSCKDIPTKVDDDVAYSYNKSGLSYMADREYDLAMKNFSHISRGHNYAKINYIYAYLLKYKFVSILYILFLAVSVVTILKYKQILKLLKLLIRTDAVSDQQSDNLTIECHVCNAMISKNARSCPNCGEPYSFIIKPFIIKYRLLLVIIALVALIGLLVWKYYPNKIDRMKFTTSNNNSEESGNHKTEEVKADPISIVDSCKAWKFEDGGYVPGIMFKVTNRLNSKISGIDFRAVWLKNGNEQFYTASTYLSNLDPNVTSQNVKLVPSKVKVISQSGRFNPVEDVEFLGKDLTVKVYYKVLFTGSDEKLIYDGPFNATFNETTPFF